MTEIAMTLYRTATGGKRHVRNCPHLRDEAVLEAAATDGEVCTWCAAELDGRGRTYCDSLQEALPRLGTARTDWPRITALVADVDPSRVWMHRTKVEWSDGDRVEHLPGFRPGAGGGPPVQEVWGETCPKHFEQRSRNGTCWRCYD